ncbi:MAG: NfeD family protein, partial [Chloroflexota bacterium]
MNRTVRAWLTVLVLLLDDAAALGLVLVLLWFFRVRLPLSVLIVIGLVLGVIIFIVHKAVIPVLCREKTATGREGVVGLTATVTEPLAPAGTVKVGDELWKAVSAGGDIAAGAEVEIIGVDGLT